MENNFEGFPPPNDFEGFPPTKKFEGFSQVELGNNLLDSHLGCPPLQWPEKLRDTDSIMDCIMSRFERDLRDEVSGSCRQEVTFITRTTKAYEQD